MLARARAQVEWKAGEGGKTEQAIIRVTPWLAYACSIGARFKLQKPGDADGRTCTVQVHLLTASPRHRLAASPRPQRLAASPPHRLAASPPHRLMAAGRVTRLPPWFVAPAPLFLFLFRQLCHRCRP